MSSSSQCSPEGIDIFLLPTKAWEIWRSSAHRFLADDSIKFSEWEALPISYCAFRAHAGSKQAFAFCIEEKRIDLTAVVTTRILNYYSTLSSDEGPRYRIDRMILIGFCGTLKGDEFRVGDVGVASQVDCYMEKAKIANLADPELSGEVYRTSLKYVRLAQNLKYLDPQGFESFTAESRKARAEQLDKNAMVDMRPDAVGIHTPHLASATLLSTTDKAVRWLRERDRKLFMIDMESGGMMAAVWQHNQNYRSIYVETIVIRTAVDFGDEHRERLRPYQPMLRVYGVETACRFLAWMLKFDSVDLRGLPPAPPESTSLGIVVPLEEEFSYLVEQLRTDLHPFYDTVNMRFGYWIDFGGHKASCMFMGDMGLAQAALTASGILNSSPGIALLILVGIAGSISKEILVCDVAVATHIDSYLQGARSGTPTMGTFEPTPADEALLEKIAAIFQIIRGDMQQSYRELLFLIEDTETISAKLRGQIRSHEDLMLHAASFATGDAVAASRDLHAVLRSGERNNRVVDMESGGIAVAVTAHNQSRRTNVRTLFLRGISDNASPDKEEFDRVKPAGILRRIAMRNACSLIAHLARHPNFWDGVIGSAQRGPAAQSDPS